jgi:phosphatidate cytidylyltransferase
MIRLTFQDLSVRLLVSALISIVLLISLYFSIDPRFKYFHLIVVLILTLLATLEYAQLAVKKGLVIPIKTQLFFAGAFVLNFFIQASKKLDATNALCIVFISLFSFFLFCLKQKKAAITTTSVLFFPLIYIALPLGLTFVILFGFPEGRIWLAYLISVTKLADIGAYFGGRVFGKHKLAPQASPKKTWEGTIIGVATGIVASIIFSEFFITYSHFTMVVSGFLGLLLGIGGQFGDLFESILKRDAKIKDSNTLPGIGGVLDLIDSLLFNIPIVLFFLTWTL